MLKVLGCCTRRLAPLLSLALLVSLLARPAAAEPDRGNGWGWFARLGLWPTLETGPLAALLPPLVVGWLPAAAPPGGTPAAGGSPRVCDGPVMDPDGCPHVITPPADDPISPGGP